MPNSTLYGPIYRFSATSTTSGARCNMVFTAAEMAAAGILPNAIITSIAFNKTNSANFLIPVTYNIYMNNSSTVPPLLTTTTWASIVADFTQVFASTSYNVPLAAGWVQIPVTPFIYTGGSLEIATHLQMTGGSTGATDMFKWEYTNGFATSLVGVASPTGTTLNGTVTGYKHRPNIRITYTPGSPCTNPPTAGTTTTSAVGLQCPGANVDLSLTGNATGVGLTFEWERSPSNTPFTPTSLAPPSISSDITITPTVTAWYRAKLVCSGGTPVYSSPIQIQVVSGFPAGTYTINSAVATGGTNYQSFTDAIAALSCGIAGPVVFNVVPGSGPYNEMVDIGNVSNTSATNTVKFNGNGAVVQFDNTTTDRALLTLDGSKYIKIDSLTFKSLDADYGYGALITNNAAYDSITRCTFDLTSIDGTSSTASSGIVFSASGTSATTAGDNGDHCYIGYNKIVGRTGAGGPYYGISIAGSSDSNYVVNNLIQNFYIYGVRISDAAGTVLSGNNINRSTKTATTTFYGIYTTGTMPGTIISGNRVHTPFDNASTNSEIFYGMYLLADGTASNPVNIYNNLIYNINQGGIIRGIYVSGWLP